MSGDSVDERGRLVIFGWVHGNSFGFYFPPVFISNGRG